MSNPILDYEDRPVERVAPPEPPPAPMASVLSVVICVTGMVVVPAMSLATDAPVRQWFYTVANVAGLALAGVAAVGRGERRRWVVVAFTVNVLLGLVFFALVSVARGLIPMPE